MLVAQAGLSETAGVSELGRKAVANFFWNHELEEELRELKWQEYTFFTADDREKAMEEIDAKRAVSLYEHNQCSEECQRRGEYGKYEVAKQYLPASNPQKLSSPLAFMHNFT